MSDQDKPAEPDKTKPEDKQSPPPEPEKLPEQKKKKRLIESDQTKPERRAVDS